MTAMSYLVLLLTAQYDHHSIRIKAINVDYILDILIFFNNMQMEQLNALFLIS